MANSIINVCLLQFGCGRPGNTEFCFLFACFEAYRQRAHLVGIPEFKWLERYQQMIGRKSFITSGSVEIFKFFLHVHVQCSTCTIRCGKYDQIVIADSSRWLAMESP